MKKISIEVKDFELKPEKWTIKRHFLFIWKVLNIEGSIVRIGTKTHCKEFSEILNEVYQLGFIQASAVDDEKRRETCMRFTSEQLRNMKISLDECWQWL